MLYLFNNSLECEKGRTGEKVVKSKVEHNMSWSTHISQMIGRANSALAFFRRNFGQSMQEVKAKCYQTYNINYKAHSLIHSCHMVSIHANLHSAG